eukprot:SAG31_NODE_29216_length_399_cov_0.673333_1_plen_23_part_01
MSKAATRCGKSSANQLQIAMYQD